MTPHPSGGYVRVITTEHNTLYSDAEGRSHRLDGPAITRKYDGGSIDYWVNGRPHRLDGPAVIRAIGPDEWWLFGRPVTEEKHAEIVARLRATGEAP